MAKQPIKVLGNATSKIEEYFLARVTTTDATVTIIDSISVASGKSCFIIVTGKAVKSDLSASNCGTIMASFIRPVAGNIGRDSNQAKTLIGSMNGATFNINENVGTQTADITISGNNSTTINWDILVQIIYDI